MKHRINNLRRSPLIKRLLQVISGNSAAQLIVVLAAPLITRLFSPEVFGIQGVFLAAVSLLAPLVALRYPMAIVMAKGDREIRLAEQASLLIAASTCSLLLLLLLFVRQPISAVLGVESLGLLVLFLPVMLFFTALQEIADYRAARFGRFKEVGLVTAKVALLVNSSRVLGGLVQPVASTLVIVSTVGPALHASILTSWMRKKGSNAGYIREAASSIRTFIKRNKEFPLLRAPADLLNAASQALPVILLTALSGPAIAGFYTLARSVLNLPSNVIGNAIGKVYYAHFADKSRAHEPLLMSAVKSTVALLAGPGLLVVVICFFAPFLFDFIFGSQWYEAGLYARWMSIWIATNLAAVPTLRLAPVIGRQGLLLGFRVITLLVQLVSMIVAQQLMGDAIGMVITFSLVSAALNVILVVLMLFSTLGFDRQNV